MLNGAEILERWNKLDELDLWLKKAVLNLEEIPSEIFFYKVKLLWRRQNFEGACKLIKTIETDNISEKRKANFLNLKAKCFEYRKDFDGAYRCYEEMNLNAQNSAEYLKHDPEKYFLKLNSKLEKLKSGRLPKISSSPVKENNIYPVFLVGFPRSGTTLLDTILRSHSEIVVVEEIPALESAQSCLVQNGYFDIIDKTPSFELINEARKAYEIEFYKHIKSANPGNVFVDKLPLNLLDAYLIESIYPKAKFILALRHPMDTILSCWMQNFKINSAMANMVNLDRIVQFYCVAMETFNICRIKCNLKVHQFKYENLLKDFKGETCDLLKFLDLEWEPEMENYQETALNRGRINTPSYSQVVQPIYTDAQYRWLNYRKYLDQYLDQVKPWISEFGYS